MKTLKNPDSTLDQPPDPERMASVPSSSRGDMRCLSADELVEGVTGVLSERPFRARQIHRWLHKRCAASFEEMSDLSLDLRRRLAESFRLDSLTLRDVQRSIDGTAKLALATTDDHIIEVVYIPEWKGRDSDATPLASPPDRSTLCVSTQLGCAMGCAFCKTATMGLTRNLTAGEILDQVYRAVAWLRAEGAKGERPISNLVFMGMGEPLANFENVKKAIEHLTSPEGLNFSNRHVTVSTCGLVPMMERLALETDVKIAVSLTGTTDSVRDALMPVNKRWPIGELMRTCRRIRLKPGRRITFEYVLLSGVTDSLDDAGRLARLLRGVPSKINLIQFNECTGLPFSRPPDTAVNDFRDFLVARGLTVVVRRSRGLDIAGACGQLAAQLGS